MNVTAEQLHSASIIDAKGQELAGAGYDDATILGEMVDYMPGCKRLMDTATRDEMDALCGRFAGVFRYAHILEATAAGIRSGAIQVPR